MWGQTASQKREIIKNDKISLPENRDRKEGVAMYKYALTYKDSNMYFHGRLSTVVMCPPLTSS